jgi:pimeloyl-ACP methyl ester carboxylesterase
VPHLTRPDGTEIHWDEKGEGPLIVLASQFFGYPEVFQGVTDDLARDHRVVTYDIRGTGLSSRNGPYEIATDAEDLGALVRELGEEALVLSMGDGSNRAVRLAARSPDLVRAIVTPGGNPIGREAARGSDALVDSPAVLEALVGMMETDYRAALRTMVAGANPQMSEEEARERVDRVVAYCPQEAGAPRLRDWIKQDAREDAQAVGDRLWVLELDAGNPWFAADAMIRTRKLLPDAHIERLSAGVLSRPDVTAAVVRRVTGTPAPEAELSEAGQQPA